MNLDELQSVQARERQSSDLQHLRASFYREVGEFIRELAAERAEAVEAAEDPFSAPEVRRLSDDIETAEQTVEAIYERRVGKVVKKASIAAAGMPVDDDGLTDEEAALFDDLVDRIERNRDTVLAVLDGDPLATSPGAEESTTGGDSHATASESPPAESDVADSESGDGVGAADLMGDADSPDASSDATDPPEPPAPDAEDLAGGDATPEEPPADAHPEGDGGTDADAAGTGADAVGPDTETDRTQGDDDGPVADDERADTDPESAGRDAAGSGTDVPGVPRTTVRITADDVGEVVGADGRDYELSAEDVVTLPEPNAEVLLDKDAAERLE